GAATAIAVVVTRRKVRTCCIVSREVCSPCAALSGAARGRRARRPARRARDGDAGPGPPPRPSVAVTPPRRTRGSPPRTHKGHHRRANGDQDRLPLETESSWRRRRPRLSRDRRNVEGHGLESRAGGAAVPPSPGGGPRVGSARGESVRWVAASVGCVALALHLSTPLVRALAFRGSGLTPGALEAQTGGLESMADLKRRAVDLAGPGRSAGVVLAVALAFVIAIVTELMRAGG